jgi:N-acyl-D-amino-acid deacylase
MKSIDLLIKNGLIFDGTGAEPFRADLGIAGERIATISPISEKNLNPDRIINLDGLSVAPGFIDVHAHSEFALLADSRAEGKISQGITTEINGNCGLSASPLLGEALIRREDDLKDIDIQERWMNFQEYFDLLNRRKPALNCASLVGHGNLRASIMGYDDREPTEHEMNHMKSLLDKALKEGALGLSSGLIYPPGIYSNTEELIELCRVLRKSRHPQNALTKKYGIFTSHMRSEGNRLIESIEEIIQIGKDADIPVHISHIKTSGKDNWHKIHEAISVIEDAQNAGIHVTCDRYPYTAASTDLDTILPSWVYAGGSEEVVSKLRDAKVSQKIKKEIFSRHPDSEYWENIRIATVVSPENQWMVGKSIAEIACAQRSESLDVAIKILIEEKMRVTAIFSFMSEDNLRKFLSLPYVVIGTDSTARSSDGPTFQGKPHPRGFGSFPRFLGKYVRDESLMSMSAAIRKITMVPSKIFHISQRGILKEGAYADIVIFDADTIIDRATYEEPFNKSKGIHFVIVNGKIVYQDGSLTNERPGKILQHGE